MTTWYKELEKAFSETGEDIKHMLCTLSQEELDKTFNNGWGGHEGMPFTAWGEKYVYFPVVYDGAEWVGYARRDPCDEASHHWGGE